MRLIILLLALFLETTTGSCYIQDEGFRYRDLEVGTFLTRDPLGFVDGPNLYTYVNQNPWTKFDPEGLAADVVIDAGFIVYDVGRMVKNVVEVGWEMSWTGVHKVMGNEAKASASWDAMKQDARELRSATADLGLDVVGAAIPGACGLSKWDDVAKATAKTLDKTTDTAKVAENVTDAAKIAPSNSAKEIAARVTPNVKTGAGYGVNDPAVRIQGTWTEADFKAALQGKPPASLGRPDLHHADQMPGSAIHEVLPAQHRGNPALHPNTFNQGVTPQMRAQDRQLHWWYRAREQGADQLYPDLIYD